MAEVNTFKSPDYSNAVPDMSNIKNQGGIADVHYTDENTWSGADERSARMDQHSTFHIQQEYRGIHVDPIGGSNNPGQGKGGRVSVSANQSGPTQVAPGNYVS